MNSRKETKLEGKQSDATEPIAKKVKLTAESDKSNEAAPTKRNKRPKVFSEVIEIDSDDSKSDAECVEHNSTKSISSGETDKSPNSRSESQKTEMMLSVTYRADKNIQTVHVSRMSTNANKAGKILPCSGIFKSAKVDNEASAVIDLRSKSTQTGGKRKGKIIYSIAKLPVTQD